MSTTNSPAFDSNMDPNNVVANLSNETSPVQPTKKMTKKQEKDLERAAKKKAKEEAAAAKELAKKAKADEKATKALAKEQAKKDKEEAKAAKELAKKEKAEAKLNKANAKKSNTSSSQDLPQESSQDLPQESSQDLPQESSQNLSQDLPLEPSQDLPLEPSQDLALESSLPAKFNKFFEFAYFLIKHFEKSGHFSHEQIASMTQHALLLDDVPSQSSLIHSFIDSQKLLSADLKRLRKSSSSKPSSSNNSDFVAQLVQHALHDHNDLPILTNPFSFHNQHFLIDNDNNLYHSELHHTLGKWNPISQQIYLY